MSLRYTLFNSLLAGTLLLSSAWSQEKDKKNWDFSWTQFISDTLVIEPPVDSTFVPPEITMVVRDNRPDPGPVIGIKQIKKWRYIPVDQYLTLEEPLADLLGRHLPADTTLADASVVIDNLSIWYDGKPWFLQGWTLNAYTRLVNADGTTLRDWQWEHRIKKKRKRKAEVSIGMLVDEWTKAHGQVLQKDRPVIRVSPYRYRRQLMVWVDTILMPDGYIFDTRVAIDFPADQASHYIRGAPGMGIYYRRSSRHESVAIGGKHHQWYWRPRPAWLGRFNLAYRLGANNFNTDKFDYIDWRNIFLVNLGLTAALEYRPPYYKGLYAGIGIHQSISLMPGLIQIARFVNDTVLGSTAAIAPLQEIISPYETGLAITVGVLLP
ncbi:MAG: hypothetical protein JSW54_06230 [Fidelibacterota bacterium]|nr:MAG: hypothetical protein JSW54_06230 [Candidatus Neomarinimicrobiota bacterium]